VPVFGNHRKLLFLPVAATAAALTFTTFSAGPALAAPAHSVQATSASARRAVPTRLRAYNWAKTQYRKPYEYGGTGPSGYDCSGLVMEAYRHAGISLPRTTYEMLRSWHLVRVSRPVRSGVLRLRARGAVRRRSLDLRRTRGRPAHRLDQIRPVVGADRLLPGALTAGR
jgi:hypothetical protein